MMMHGFQFVIILVLCQSYKNEALNLKKNSLLKGARTILDIDPLVGFKLVIPEACEKIGICESIPNYPKEFVLDIIKKLIRNKIDIIMYMNHLEDDDQGSHFTEDIELCSSKRQKFIPQAVRDVRNNWHLILNSEENSQGYFGELCNFGGEENKQCSKTIAFPNNYHGECVQKYMQRRMIGLNSELNKVTFINVDVPSCCSCVLQLEQ